MILPRMTMVFIAFFAMAQDAMCTHLFSDDAAYSRADITRHYSSITQFHGISHSFRPITGADCDSLDITAIVQTPTCPGQCNGTIQLMVSGGQAPYTVMWNTGSSQTTIGALCIGEYVATVTDSTGCIDSLTVVINVPVSIVITAAEIVHATNGQSNGSLTAAVSGGTEPYRYTLETASSTFQNIPTFTGLPAGMYAVSILDGNNCTGMSDSFEIQNLLGIAEIEQKFRWYPNPASSHLIAESDIPLTLEILDMHGSILKGVRESVTHYIPLDGIKPGIYVLRLSDGNNAEYHKLLVLQE